MKSDKELFELFRKNEFGLNQKPSPSAWRRLERRLDQHHSQQRHQFRRILSMAASLVFLIFIVGLLSLYTKSSVKTYDYHTQYLQSVEPTRSPAKTSKLIKLSYQYQQSIKNPIQEGNPDKKLFANKEFIEAD